jgi:hypothetical protein
MFIVIEGPDGSGKSSLIEAIKAEIASLLPDVGPDLISFHKGRPPEETRRCLLHEYAASLEKDDLFSHYYVADRWHWGERTYAPFKRPHTNKDGYGLLGKSGWRWVELFLQSRGVAQFMLYQKLDVIKARVSERGDDFIDVSELESIYNAYVETAHVSVLAETIMPGESSLGQLPAFARHIIDVATAVAVRAEPLQNFPQYIGPIKPKILLVGDERNVTEEFGDETLLPFFPVASSSGDFLLSSLPDTLWKHVGIINGNEIEPSMLSVLHRTLGQPPIAALGRMAEKALLRTTVHADDYVTIPHPQSVRRFRHSEKEEYGNAILSISRGEGANGWELQ